MTAGRPVRRSTKTTLQIALALVGAGVLAIPPLVVALSGTASTDPLWTALRIAALEAFTLVSAGVTVGAFRPVLGRVIKAKTLHRLHVSIGATGFGLAIAHGIMVSILGLAGYGSRLLLVMPLATLAILLLLIASALDRRRLKRTWRWIHRLSYLLVAVILIHAFRLGYDMDSSIAVKIAFAVYAAIIVAGLTYRLASAVRASRRSN